MVEEIFARSEGNPLYAEELVDAVQPGMPELLADLFLARMYALSEDARTLLRLASVSGTRLDTATLLPLSGLGQDRVGGLLREALDARVLRQTSDALEFRHGLLREAVYDDLMPDERSRIHAELAAILQAGLDAQPDPELTALSRAAFHWNAGHDLSHALAASVGAGTAAARLGAAEEVTHRERALALWDQVPDAESVAGLAKIELVVLLAESSAHRATASGGTRSLAEPSTWSSRTPAPFWPAARTPRWPSAACSTPTQSVPRRRCIAPSTTRASRPPRSWHGH